MAGRFRNGRKKQWVQQVHFSVAAVAARPFLIQNRLARVKPTLFRFLGQSGCILLVQVEAAKEIIIANVAVVEVLAGIVAKN
jgi:hypothetical protein